MIAAATAGCWVMRASIGTGLVYLHRTLLLDAYEEHQGRAHLLASGEYNLVVCTPINFEKALIAWMLFH